MKKALCVGINDYAGFVNDLKGCVNDANDWGTILEYAGFEVDKVFDAQATKSTVLSTFDHLITSAKAGDEIVFTYSGHGTSVADRSGDEIDGYDEALVLRDGTVLDDELRTILQKADPGVHITIVSDSCFSGTVTRALISDTAKPRYVKTEDIPLAATLKKKFLEDADMLELLISGCTDSEYSYDAEINGRWNGAMTAYAVSEMRAGQTYNEFYEKLRQHLPSDDYPQTPQLEGSDANKNRPVFAANTEPLPPSEPVVPGGLWAWLKKYWWVILIVLIVGFVVWRYLL
ncbi:caspase family protein [candidate division KSB1 bacterium]|nr:caspase family protein [candidate division KSB1 bacterium]